MPFIAERAKIYIAVISSKGHSSLFATGKLLNIIIHNNKKV